MCIILVTRVYYRYVDEMDATTYSLALNPIIARSVRFAGAIVYDWDAFV